MSKKIRGDYKTRKVWIGEQELLPGPSQRIVNHSPDGFGWGYGGSGPSQLALAIVFYYCKNKSKAIKIYQDFKWDIIAELPQTDFEISETSIRQWIDIRADSL